MNDNVFQMNEKAMTQSFHDLPAWVNEVGVRSVLTADRAFSANSHGAVGNGSTHSTKAIQQAIDACSQAGGGTVTFEPGEYVSGALFLKPGVNLHLEKGAVLKCSTDMANFPEQRTRIEGHFEESWSPAL